MADDEQQVYNVAVTTQAAILKNHHGVLFVLVSHTHNCFTTSYDYLTHWRREATNHTVVLWTMSYKWLFNL
jgi:hypothetical protein